MENKEKTKFNKRTTKCELIIESSIKDIKPFVEYVFLKENLFPKEKTVNSSTHRNPVKLLIGKNRESINKIVKTAYSLSKYNSKLTKLADRIKTNTERKEEALISVNERLDTEVNNKISIKRKINSISREKKILENKIQDKICLTNKLKQNIDNIEDQVKLFEETVKSKQESVEENKVKYKEIVDILENEVSDKREKCRILQELNKSLTVKIEELNTEEKKLKTDIKDEYKYLKEKSLINKALIDELIINLTELNKKSYTYQIHFDKNFTLDEKTGQYKSKNNSKLLMDYYDAEKQNNELRNQVQNLKLMINNTASNEIEGKNKVRTRNVEKMINNTNTVTTRIFKTKS